MVLGEDRGRTAFEELLKFLPASRRENFFAPFTHGFTVTALTDGFKAGDGMRCLPDATDLACCVRGATACYDRREPGNLSITVK